VAHIKENMWREGVLEKVAEFVFGPKREDVTGYHRNLDDGELLRFAPLTKYY
jgi:hypothetical protein